MNSHWKLILLLAGIFGAGVMSGVFLDKQLNTTVKPGPHHVSTVAVEKWAPDQMKRLGDALDLTPEQIEQIRPVVRRNMEELDRLRTYSRSETAGIFDRMKADINEKLTPEQRTKYDEMNRQREREIEGRSTKGFNKEVPSERLKRESGDRPPPPPGELPPPPKK